MVLSDIEILVDQGSMKQVLRFRNMHVDVPYYGNCLLKDKDNGEQMSFRTGYEIHSVRWPRSCGELNNEKANGMGGDAQCNIGDGRDRTVMVRSEEGFSRILLHPGQFGDMIFANRLDVIV